MASAFAVPRPIGQRA